MADNTILTPGHTQIQNDPILQETQQYLTVDNRLSEYKGNEEAVAFIRDEVLGVPSVDSILTESEINELIVNGVKTILSQKYGDFDPLELQNDIDSRLEGMVKDNGTTPFTKVQSGIYATSDKHLATLKNIKDLIKEHKESNDPHNILPQVDTKLEKYVRTSEVFKKDESYNQSQIDNLLSQYVKSNGSTRFTSPVQGVTPVYDWHLATKGYADKVLKNHLLEIDPHGFTTILNQRLASYIKKKDVFDKTQTYSRTQIDSIIQNVVNEVVESSINDYVDGINDKLEFIRKEKYTKQDGSIPFINPQQGVDAIEDTDLTTLRQVQSIVKNATSQIDKFEWKTSGPVTSQVGHVSTNTLFGSTVSFQEIMDRIFYGKGIVLEVPEYVIITQKAPITVCVQGASAEMDFGEIYQDGQLIYTLTKDDFEDHCLTLDSLPIQNDTEILFKVTYVDGTVHDETRVIYCAPPIFIGLLPKWKFGNTVSFDYLTELYNEDPENNTFVGVGKDVVLIEHQYNFEDPQLRHPFIVLPADYPDLYQFSNSSQQFSSEAFEVINMIPYTIPGSDHPVIYKMYIYKQALSKLSQKVKFEFQ